MLNEKQLHYAKTLSDLTRDEILQRLGIKHYDKDILKMSNVELLKEFGKSAKNINKSLFIKNVIWQVYERLKKGDKPFDIGNIRSFWYYIKDTVDRVGATKKGDLYNLVSDMFVLLVKAKLFKYKDFGFDDDDKGNRWLGRKNYNIIFFAEKTSYTDLLQELNQEYDITTIASGGQTSHLSVEYLVSELKSLNFDLTREFIIFSLVDFDPAGDTIADNFTESLIDNGIKKIRTFPGKFSTIFYRKDIFIPDNLTEEQKSKVYRLPLSVRKSGQAARWAARTGGVDGRKNIQFGIETIVLSKAGIKQIFETEISKIMTIDLEAIAKYRSMFFLKDYLNLLALKKLKQET